jgi:hypothetical protein
VSVATRKSAELEHKLASLEEEFRHWSDRSADGRELEKHHTQVQAVTGELAVPVAALKARLDGLVGARVLEEAGQVEGMVLDLHRIWDVFRGKLALRYVDHFADYLLAADELAYCCYEPAERRGAAREPPLVFFGDALSPVIRTRGSTVPFDGGAADEALRRLRVPLIGIPWFQIEHLPDAPIIAHEVGHEVYADLALDDTAVALLSGAVAAAPEERRRAWSAWREEAFADVFGTLALGPAFTSSLIDFLATEPRLIALQWQADPDWRAHPPSALRVLLSAATLEAMPDFADAAVRLRAGWREAYPSHAMEAFEPDVPAVARALAAGSYDALCGGPLSDLVSFGGESQERAERDARDVPRDFAPRSTDARELVAAARLAYDADPRGYRAGGTATRILQQIRCSQTVGTRAGSASPVAESTRQARDAAAGEWLLDRLAREHAADV